MPADGDGQAADGDGRPPDDQPATGPDRPPQPINRRALFGIFFKAGLAFGGGLGILAVLEQELVTRRRAVGREEFLRLYGLGRIVPSGTMTALAVAYGYRFAGLAGTVISLAAVPKSGPGRCPVGLDAAHQPANLAHGLLQQVGVGRVVDVGLHHGGVHPQLAPAQQLVVGELSQQRVVELGDDLGPDGPA